MRKRFAAPLGTLFLLSCLLILTAFDNSPKPGQVLDEARAAGLIAAGSPKTVRDYLANFIDESGINYLAVRIAFGDLSLEQSLHSLDLLTEHVFPDLAELASAVA